MKKRHKGLWITLASIAGFMSVVSIVGFNVTAMYKTQIDVSLKVNTFKTVETGTSEEKPQWFKSSFASAEERAAAEAEVCTNLEAEGATLLMNKNNTLPLSSSSKFSLFGTSAIDPIYGGTGSGQVSTDNAVSLRSALTAEFGKGCSNPTLLKRYLSDLQQYRRVNAATTGGTIDQYRINEAPWAEIMTDEVKKSMSSYGDVALVVIGRSGGEGNDLPTTQCGDGMDGNYLRLNQNEVDMLEGLKSLKDAGTVKKIVVLLNGSNTVQLDFLDKAEYGIDACAWIGDVGTTGMTAVAELLSGKRNFSGRLSDTFLKNHMASPVMANFGLQAFTNASDYDTGYVQYNDNSDNCNKCNENYIVYQEGIYVGYRYFETRYADYVLNQGNAGDYHYSEEVAYPFGFGESYTEWSYSNFQVKEAGDFYTVDVDVTNVGDRSGKNSVEIYVSTPFTEYDKTNHIEKSAVTLGGFAKTAELAPGEKEHKTIQIKKRDIASYDTEGAGTYILDEGDYFFTVGKNAHDANNNILAANPVANKSRMDAAGDSSLVGKIHQESLDDVTCSTSEITGEKIENAFDHADINRYEGTKDQKIHYLSRTDWTNTFPTTNVKLAINDKMWADGLTSDPAGRTALVEKMKKEHYAELKDAALPAMGQNNGRQLIQYRELDYNDETANLWQELISQASYDEMTNVIYNGFHNTNEIASIGLPATANENGPQGYTAMLVGNGGKGMAYTSEDIMASTRNTELVKKMGECIGEDCLVASTRIKGVGNAGLYGPGCNIHRTMYSGRNFEYYSEDPILSSRMCEPEVRAIQSKGVFVFTKHFALNDQESGRYGLSTWANEQSIREIYLKAFEGNALAGGSGVMSSFNRLGVTWAGADYSLMTTVLRKEFGHKGAAITDCSVYATYMDPAMGVLAGQDLWDGNAMKGSAMRTLDNYSNDPIMVSCVQRATTRIAYSVSHSLGMNGISSNSVLVPVESWYLTLLRGMAIGFGVLTLCFGGLIAYDVVKAKKDAKEAKK